MVFNKTGQERVTDVIKIGSLNKACHKTDDNIVSCRYNRCTERNPGVQLTSVGIKEFELQLLRGRQIANPNALISWI